ncbi:hypothetical protein HYH03_015470 [Edaphochlamys debaryana]|uniref:Uncharacterized protein n=1 Tax=Edaphochlamys debaryana TaxID=47281 RepID=A0A835XN87_9CHLO|nr:hypothetical protein HYH03_015470 [Edaphochlamys debaryana]|eukprot:KAG2485888.1 hypothetical protein HYH03_015470 [Edaphochlamys debaryana]
MLRQLVLGGPVGAKNGKPQEVVRQERNAANGKTTAAPAHHNRGQTPVGNSGAQSTPEQKRKQRSSRAPRPAPAPSMPEEGPIAQGSVKDWATAWVDPALLTEADLTSFVSVGGDCD